MMTMMKLKVGDYAYAPTYDDNGVLYKVSKIESTYIELIHNNHTFIIDENLTFLKTPLSTKALKVLYPYYTFDDDMYIYGNNALDKLLSEGKTNILTSANFGDRTVYVNVVEEIDRYYVDDNGCRWTDLKPVTINEDGSITEKRIICND